MKLTAKGRYAVTAITDIALHGESYPVSLADIAKRQAISLSYLEQVFAQLKKEGIVQSIRGPGGGYRLARLPHQISVRMIVLAVRDGEEEEKCKGNGNCHEDSRCLTHLLWQRLETQLEQFLDTITVADLIEDNREHNCDACEHHHH